MMTGEIAYLSAAELATVYRSGALSPVEAVRTLLDRIDAFNPKINAVHAVARQTAPAEARAAEERFRRGEPRGPLDGVPVTIKDSVPVAGFPNFHGTMATGHDVPPETVDAPLVARLREDGAIVIGKTTTPDFSMIASGVSSRYGTTRNPWDLSRNSGGSSAGAGAGTAAGFAPLAVGTDIGGSIRIPSAFCGVFGLKPSYGRVPYHRPAPWLVAGPMTRTVRDAALMMNSITRPDRRDFAALPYDERDYAIGLDDGVAGMRIGVLEHIGFGLPIEPEIGAALRGAADVFADLGAIVEPTPPIFEDDPEPDFDRCVHLGSYLLFSGLSPENRQAMLPFIAEWCSRRTSDDVLDLMRSQLAVADIRKRVLAPFDHCDYLLCPTMAVLPYAAELPWPPGGTPHNPFCFPFNISEQPAASFNAGLSNAGLPIGLQIVGDRFDDAGVLRMCHAFEAATNYSREYPKL